MKKQEAINLFLKVGKVHMRTINYLTQWNPNMNLQQLSKKMDCSEECCRNIAVRYGLKFKKVPRYQ